ncbi:MAG: crossover junction endodeoxyribonuclease RuvC [Parcubacteria group bacterium]|nr:crossover junction endodeoxyribonuclease RuvC [Parcubacteria group bacterium]MCR4342796.1 crossover junction endodeoxyribonuclease RuvC [Patescibacteria group bacterium]
MIILGIDPGYERLGIAILEKKKGREELLFSDCIKTSAKIPFNERLFIIGKELEKIIKKWKPDITAIEKLFFTTNQKTAMRVSEVRGLIIYLVMLYKSELREFTPLEIKTAVVGYGKAEKRQVEHMVKTILKLKDKEMADDETDAIACALTCSACLPADLSTSRQPIYPLLHSKSKLK